MSDKDISLENLKELNDLEFEIVFIESLTKKIKTVLDNHEISTSAILLVYFSIVETLKKFKLLAEDNKKEIPHSDAVNLIIAKSEEFLRNVANNEDKAPYAFKSLSDIYELMKSLMFVLKKELTESPEYSHLKVNLE